MTEIDDAAMDARLRIAIGAAPPTLSPAFDRQVMTRIRCVTPRPGARLILASYGAVSLMLSAWVVLALPSETRIPVVMGLVTVGLVGLAPLVRRWKPAIRASADDDV